jgi:hypothetical protein
LRDGVVGPHHVDEQALRAALHRRRRDDHHVDQAVELHAHVDELVGKEAGIVVAELRLELDRAGRGIDLVVGRHENAVRQLRLLLPVPGLDRDLLAGLQATHHHRHAVLRHGEEHRHRLQLRDHHQAVGVARSHDVAGIDQAQAGAAADRRSDARVGELQLRVLDLAAVDAHRALVLADEGELGVDLLLGDRVLLEQRLVALQVELRVLEQRAVPGELALGLLELHLEGARIDFGKEVALLHRLSFLEKDAHQLAVDARAHRDGSQGRHRAQAAHDDIDVAQRRRRADHRRRSPAHSATALLQRHRRGRRACAPVVAIHPPGGAGDDGEADEREDELAGAAHQSSSL